MSAPLTAEYPHPRAASRRRVLKNGIIAFLDGHCTMDCVVRDLSDNGARLRFDTSLLVPDRFQLIIDSDGLIVECEVRWRRGQHVGVLFLHAPKVTPLRRRQVIIPFAPKKPVLLRRKAPLTVGRSSASPKAEPALEPAPTQAPVKEDRPISVSATSLPAAPSNETPPESLLPHLLILQAEARRIGILTAMSGSVSNAVAAGHGEPRDLIRFYPRESSKLMFVTIQLARWFEHASITKSLRDALDDLAAAKQASITFASNGFQPMMDYAGKRDELASPWRQAARTTYRLLTESSSIIGVLIGSPTSNESDELLETLAAVAEGASPLVGADGTASLPNWAERRGANRIRIGCSAYAIVNGRQAHLRVRDLSRTGLGIDSAFPLPLDYEIRIQFGEDLRLNGRVSWVDGTSAGIELHRPLSNEETQFAIRASAKPNGLEFVPSFKPAGVDRCMQPIAPDHTHPSKSVPSAT